MATTKLKFDTSAPLPPPPTKKTFLENLPPPPKGQQGFTLDELQHLPPPPKGQQGYTLEEIQAQSQPKKSFLQKAGDVVNKISQGITNLVGAEGISEQFGADIARLKAPNKQQKNLVEYPSMKKVVGSAIQTGANLIPGLGAEANLATKIGAGAATGYAFDVGGKLQKGNEVGESLKPGVGTVVGGALPIAGAGLKKAVDALVIKTPRQLVNFTLKVPAKQVGKELNEAFLARKLGGNSLQGIYDKTASEVQDVEKLIQEKLINKRIATSDDIINSIIKDAKSKGATVTTNTIRDRIKKFVPDYAALLDKPVLTDKELNNLRMAIDNNLKEASFLGKELTNEQKVVKAFADKSRRVVQKASGTEKLFKQQSEAIGLRNLAEQAMKKAETQNKPGGLGDILGAGAGAVIGGGIPGAVGGIIAKRVATSPQVQGASARVLRAADKLRPYLNSITPAEKKILMDLIQNSREDQNNP